jgi:hypothetical protein
LVFNRHFISFETIKPLVHVFYNNNNNSIY